MIAEDLKNFRASPSNMERLLVSLGVTAVVMLVITAHTMTYHAEVAMAQEQADAMQERAKQSTALASHFSELVAACMNGSRIVWTDPHDKADYAAICEVVRLGRIR